MSMHHIDAGASLILPLFSSVVKAIVSRNREAFIARAIVEFGFMMVRSDRHG